MVGTWCTRIRIKQEQVPHLDIGFTLLYTGIDFHCWQQWSIYPVTRNSFRAQGNFLNSVLKYYSNFVSVLQYSYSYFSALALTLMDIMCLINLYKKCGFIQRLFYDPHQPTSTPINQNIFWGIRKKLIKKSIIQIHFYD